MGPLGAFLIAGGAGAADDAGSRSLQQLQLQRQQQQDALQLRMQQQQGAAQAPPAGLRDRQSLERGQSGQRQRQQEQHYRQSIEPVPVHPSDDAGVRQAKRQAAQQEALRESDAQRARFGREIEEGRKKPGLPEAGGSPLQPDPFTGRD